MLQYALGRREFLGALATIFLALRSPFAFAAAWENAFTETGAANGATRDNFRLIYSDPALRNEFKNFLVNVYHLYPEDKFHALILEVAAKGGTEKQTYEEILARVPSIKPIASEATYALPALAKQKREMAAQAADLIGKKPVNGYIEIGTPGRYVNALKSSTTMSGPVYLVHDHEPSMAPVDVAERGSLAKVGTYVPLGNYEAWKNVPGSSVDVITNFIGIHHSPRDNLPGFMASIHRALRPDGRFILRDHDAHSRSMNAMVGLAHDVYNAGLGISWEKNEQELRYFKALKEVKAYVAAQGFEPEREPLFQKGDPTKNALMLYRKKS